MHILRKPTKYDVCLYNVFILLQYAQHIIGTGVRGIGTL